MADFKNRFITEYRRLNSNYERKRYLRKQSDEALIANSPQYAMFFNGYYHLLKKETDDAIVCFKNAFKKHIELNNNDERFILSLVGLGNAYLDKKKYEISKKYFEIALKRDSSLDGFIENWLGNVYMKLKNYDEAIIHYKNAYDLYKDFAWAYNGLGNAYRRKKQYGSAKVAFEKAISIDEKYPYPYNGLGNIFKDTKKLEKAIEMYNKSIELDQEFAYPWNYLGDIYTRLEQFDEAISCYNKSVKIDGKFSFPWNGLGRANFELHNYEEAENCFIKAINIDDNFEFAHLSYAELLQYNKRYSDAKEHYMIATELFNKQSNIYYSSRVQDAILQINNEIDFYNVVSDLESKNIDDPVKKILVNTITNGIEDETYSDQQRNLMEFLQEKQQIDDFYLEVLRRWNSYTPLVARDSDMSKGGGYYVRAFGKGIVLDPGFNFLDNFKSMKHKFGEIDIVLVTHSHNDHTADLESILTLLHEYNQDLKEHTIPKDIGREKNYDFHRVPSDEIVAEYKIRKKIIDFYVTASVFKKYIGLFQLRNTMDYRVHVIEKGSEIKLADNFSFEVIAAKHDDIVSNRHSVGFLLKVKDKVVVYTGDTGWDTDIEEQYEELSKRFRSEKIILLAHIGGFKLYERRYISKDYFTSDKESKLYYENHLGRLGLAKLVDKIQPSICIISEFGEEFRGSRVKVANIFDSAFSNKYAFIPADIGLKVNLENFHVKSFKLQGDHLYSSFIEPDRINPKEMGSLIYYLNKDSDISESELQIALTRQ